MFAHDAFDILHGSRVRHGRSGSQCGFMPVRHIADRKGNLHCPRRSRRQPPTLGGRKMFAHHVDFLDRRAACNQRGMQLLKIRERHIRIQRLLHQRRPATGNQKKYQRPFIATRQTLQNRLTRRKTLRRRQRMPAHKCFPARYSRRGSRRHHQDSFRRKFRRQNFAQTPRHRQRSFPERNRHDLAKTAQVNVRGPTSRNQRTAPVQFPPQRRGNINRRQCVPKNVFSRLFHSTISIPKHPRSTHSAAAAPQKAPPHSPPPSPPSSCAYPATRSQYAAPKSHRAASKAPDAPAARAHKHPAPPPRSFYSPAPPPKPPRPPPAPAKYSPDTPCVSFSPGSRARSGAAYQARAAHAS